MPTTLIGRRTDLERLREAWGRVATGEPEMILLLGAAGMAVVRGRSFPYASSTPWEPVAELIRDLHDVGSERSAPEAVAAIAAKASTPWSEDERAGLGAVLGSPVSDLQRFLGLPPTERHERMVRAVSRALEEGVREPTLLVLEDLHWADRTTLDFLQSVAELGLRGPFGSRRDASALLSRERRAEPGHPGAGDR